MITINHCIKNKYPLNHVLTDYDKIELKKENKNANYSYQSLMKEMFHYKTTTVEDLIRGWGGVKLVKL